MKSRRSLKARPAAKLKIKLSMRYVVAGIALVVVIFTCVFLYTSLGTSKDANAKVTQKPLRISTKNGDWGDIATWSPIGLPQDGDSIVIVNGHKINMDKSIDLYNIKMKVYGSLLLISGIKFTINAASVIEVFSPNGIINGSHLGNGAKISVEKAVVWEGKDDPITGYSLINGSGLQLYQALPVELVYFKATKQDDNSVFMEWLTSSELNNDFFTIERSSNGKDFKAIDTINGAGNSNTAKKYTYTDFSSIQGTGYYRLKQIDLNGQHKYSKIVATTADFQGDAISINSIGPNPFQDRFNVEFNLEKPGFVEIQLANMQGRLLFTQSVEGSTGSNHYEFNSGRELPKGMYMLSFVQDGKISKTQRLVKQ